MKASRCHPNRAVEARGLCKCCYEKHLKTMKPEYRERHRQSNANWYRTNRDAILKRRRLKAARPEARAKKKELDRQYREKNHANLVWRENKRKSALADYYKHRAKRLQNHRKWKLQNPVIARRWYQTLEMNPKRLELRKAIAKLERQELKRQVLSHYSAGKMECACCHEKTIQFLTLDHIHNNGNQERRRIGRLGGVIFYRYLRRRGYPSGYQVLCFNCNCAKAMFGQCPHVVIVVSA